MKVGVFDSGRGGLSVAKAIEAALHDLEVVFRDDHEHVPYGTRPSTEVFGFVLPILQTMVGEGCQVIIVACNTVSTTLITELRAQIAVPVIAVEPMVKPAAEMTKTGTIAVCATPATLMSARYVWLKETYASNVQVLEPDCSDWAYMIENNQVDEEKIAGRLTEALDAGADVIVLGCTHYHWIGEDIARLTEGRATVIQPEPAVIEQLKRVLAQQ